MCKNCGSFSEPQVAGELSHPAACHICGHGVLFDQITGIRQLVPDNWVILADLPPAELAELKERRGLADGEHAIVAWTPLGASAPQAPQNIAVAASDGVGTEDVQVLP